MSSSACPRRHVLTAIPALALILTACGSTADAQGEVVIAGPGGDLGASYQKAFEQFSEAEGIEITYVEAVTSQQIAKIAAQKSNPQIDVLLGTATSYHSGLEQDLWAGLDESVAAERAKLPEVAKLDGDKEVTPLVNVPVLFYNTERYAEHGIEPPTDYLDVLADEKLRGHVAFPDISNGYMETYLGLALQEKGMPVSDPTPAINDLLAKGKDWFYQFPQSPAEMAQLVASGQVWAGLDGATRVNDMRQKGMPVEWVIPDVLASIPLSWSAVKGGPNPDAAQRFLKWSISPQGQEALLRNTLINTTTDVPVPDDLQGQVLPPEAISRLQRIDDEGIVAAADQWSAAWAELVGS